jgi:hypothetical protein
MAWALFHLAESAEVCFILEIMRLFVGDSLVHVSSLGFGGGGGGLDIFGDRRTDTDSSLTETGWTDGQGIFEPRRERLQC